jgi:hypothetical protein
MPITTKHVEILGNSLGINVYHAVNSKSKKDKELPKEFYRNRYCTSAGHDELPTIEKLVAMGYMEQGQTINDGTSVLWYVTQLGIERFKECFEALVTEHTFAQE